MIENIHWLGHDSFRIDGEGLVIYIDPWKISGEPKADIILITHDHRDHCSPEDVTKIQKVDTVIVTVDSAADQLTGKIETVTPGEERIVRGIHISTVPAYNINKFRTPGIPFHPKEKGYVGFIITIEGLRIYHAGDTDNIPEMSTFNTDIALLPVSGIYVMTADEAVEAAKTLQPKMVIPMHVGSGIGSLDDAKQLQKISPIPVTILPLES
jgi:L-ascorbate metabolism protein UlaG (beta-lactamase superfamily)